MPSNRMPGPLARTIGLVLNVKPAPPDGQQQSSLQAGVGLTAEELAGAGAAHEFS
jgi:hypothetical protein